MVLKSKENAYRASTGQCGRQAGTGAVRRLMRLQRQIESEGRTRQLYAGRAMNQ